MCNALAVFAYRINESESVLMVHHFIILIN